MSIDSLEVRCSACGRELDLLRELPFRCPNATEGDDRDHVLGFIQRATPDAWPVSLDPNPFQRFAGFSLARALSDAIGLSRQVYAQLVTELDEAVAAVDGAGFRTTPYLHDEALGLWIKDETGAVGGSHKARHLMGVALYMAVAAKVPILAEQLEGASLAISSCGNAARSAATLAAAMGRKLDVFLPTWAKESTVEYLSRLGANLHICERVEGGPPGDPCYHGFQAAMRAGSIPFTCQGHENGLAIDGGRSLAWELAEQHMSSGSPHLQRLFIQVGGGALASSSIQGLWMARDAQVIPELPAVHAVQVESVQPLVRAWRKLAAELLGESAPDHEMAARVHAERSAEDIHTAVHAATNQRSRYMWPVEGEPKSVATGILDDETYDGFAVMLGMLLTGGWPVVVSEEELVRARDRARELTGISVSATGSSGLAGAMSARAAGHVTVDEPTAVLFTGVQR